MFSVFEIGSLYWSWTPIYVAVRRILRQKNQFCQWSRNNFIWNKKVSLSLSSSGKTNSVRRIVALAPQLSCTLNSWLRSLCIINRSSNFKTECSTKALLYIINTQNLKLLKKLFKLIFPKSHFLLWKHYKRLAKYLLSDHGKLREKKLRWQFVTLMTFGR